MIPAAIAAGGAIIGQGISSAGQAKANKMNLKIAREQMAFQERMRNTEWQAGVKDMQLAGLNPALAYEKGGASAPSGSTAKMENVFAGAGDTISQMSSVAMQAAQARKTNAEAKWVEAEAAARTALLRGQLRATGMNTAKAIQDLRFGEETFSARAAQEHHRGRSALYEADYLQRSLDPRVAAAGLANELLQEQTKGQRFDNEGRKLDADFFKTIGSLPDWMQNVFQLVRLFKGRR